MGDKMGQFTWDMVRIWFCGIFVLILLFGGCGTSERNEFLEDRDALLSDPEKERITVYNQILLRDLDIHFKLITLEKRAEDIDRLASELFGTLGERTTAAKGLLFVVDRIGRQVRIEVGYDLEPVFPDGFVGYLERDQMLPFFQSGKVGAGIEATTEMLVARVQRQVTGKAFDAKEELPDMVYFSGGAGATISLEDTKKKNSFEKKEFLTLSSPEETLREYVKVLEERNKDPNLELYTTKTQEFFLRWLVTDAQQANELKHLTSSAPEAIRIQGEYAVIRFPREQRTLPPYFFQKSETGWKLDFWYMSQVIRMNHKNMWHFVSFKHPYMFGFADWTFDSNGFPKL